MAIVMLKSSRLAFASAPLVFVIGCADASRAKPAETAAPQRDLRGDARLASEQGQYVSCGELFAQASGDGKDSPGDAYDAACCQARAGDADKAFARLERAVALGYHDAKHLAADTDLERLHVDPRWPALVAKMNAALEAYLKTINEELYAIFQEDQGDRTPEIAMSLGLTGETFLERDRRRLRRVREIVEAGGAKVSADYFHAAMVFQHGTTPDEIETAHALAMKAAELKPTHPTARWLAAASTDRRLMYLGKPQLYGTQYRRNEGDKWFLYPVDPTVTDEERARWNVPPLAVAKKRAEAMNAEEARPADAGAR
jgi:hypothetical protein